MSINETSPPWHLSSTVYELEKDTLRIEQRRQEKGRAYIIERHALENRASNAKSPTANANAESVINDPPNKPISKKNGVGKSGTSKGMHCFYENPLYFCKLDEIQSTITKIEGSCLERNTELQSRMVARALLNSLKAEQLSVATGNSGTKPINLVDSAPSKDSVEVGCVEANFEGFSASSPGTHFQKILASPRARILPSPNDCEAALFDMDTFSSEIACFQRAQEICKATESNIEVPRELIVPNTVPIDDAGGENNKNSSCVTFQNVVVRYYERILTDNPAVTGGPPLGLGWRYKAAPKVYHVNEWEAMRNPYRRSSEQLVLPRDVRTSILLDLGYSQKEVADMIRQSLRVKNQRKQTVNNLDVQAMEEFVERAARKLKRLVTLSICKNEKIIAEYHNPSSRLSSRSLLLGRS